MTEQEILKIAIKAIDSKRGENIKVLKVGDLTILANYFVIANGNSSTQVKALADEVEFKGLTGSCWIMLMWCSISSIRRQGIFMILRDCGRTGKR